MKKPTIAFAGLTACFGCQLTLFNSEKELAELANYASFTYFPMGMTTRSIVGEFDAVLVEGAVAKPEDLEVLTRLRKHSRRLIAVGTCARWGGIGASRNYGPGETLAEEASGPGVAIENFTPGPLQRFVTVDASITGCPPEKDEILATIGELLFDHLPVFGDNPVCMECRMRDNLCLLVERNQPCLGPLIQSGCKAPCPAVGVPCEGCRGPVPDANVEPGMRLLLEEKFERREITHRIHRFCKEWGSGEHPRNI